MRSLFKSLVVVLLPSFLLWWFLNSSAPQQVNLLESESVRRLQHYDENVQSEINAIWKRIEVQLQKLNREDSVRLNPPATLAEIEALERLVGYRLAADYKASLLVHNGSSGKFCSSYHLRSVESMVHGWKEGVEFEGDYDDYSIHPNASSGGVFWHPGWVPVAKRNVYLIIVNIENGKVYRWDEGYYPVTYESSSWKAWLETVATRLESGQLVTGQSTSGYIWWKYDRDYRTPGSEVTR